MGSQAATFGDGNAVSEESPLAAIKLAHWAYADSRSGAWQRILRASMRRKPCLTAMNLKL
jgi:hypothetical protein